MNVYEIEGAQYRATNEYDAVKQAYKMADRIVMECYRGDETWDYIVMFRGSNGCGRSFVTVHKVTRDMSDTWVTIPATNPLPEEDRIFAAWYYKTMNWFWF